MKNIYALFIILTALNCKAQSPVIDIDNWDGESQENAYYKDVNNFFDVFEGTWLYTNGDTSFKIIIVKKTMLYTGKFYTDYVIGEYQYIENGVEKINTLANLSQSTKHGIWGSSMLKSTSRIRCDDCPVNERRIQLILSDRTRGLSGRLILKKILVNGQPALEGALRGNSVPGGIDVDNPPQYTELTVPTGTFIFIKQ